MTEELYNFLQNTADFVLKSKAIAVEVNVTLSDNTAASFIYDPEHVTTMEDEYEQ